MFKNNEAALEKHVHRKELIWPVSSAFRYPLHTGSAHSIILLRSKEWNTQSKQFPWSRNNLLRYSLATQRQYYGYVLSEYEGASNSTPNHGLPGTANTVLTATGFVNGRWQFSTPYRINTPWPITKKIGTGDYVGGSYGCAKYGANPLIGGFWANRWNITIFLFIPFFINSPTGQTRRRIFTLDGSNDADSRKDVPPFGGFVDIAPHFRGEITRKPQFWGRE